MAKKRNIDNKSVPATGHSKGYVEKYFGNDIGRILVPNDRYIHNCDDIYVPHIEAETVLSDCLIQDPDKDKSLMFTGLTGSGKTTILRHVFTPGLHKNEEEPGRDLYVINVDFNRSQINAQEGILSSLRAAVSRISDTYGIEYPDTENLDFYEYIKEENREDFTELDAHHGRKTPFKERLETFLNKMPIPFASCQLQYIMEQPTCGLSLIVLVVDNIEAFLNNNAKNSQERYLSPVIEAFRLADCIAKRNSPSSWSFNMVIACRHHIWRMMTGEFSDNNSEITLLQSYVATEVPYDLAEPVNVNDIVKKREDVFSKRQRDPYKWSIAVNVVNTVLKAVDDSIGDFILQLELKDMRKSFAKIQQLVLNRGLQKVSNEQIEAGAFRIDSIEQFDLTRVNIIRVLGLGNNSYYASRSSIIPNLLYNDSKLEMNLYPLLTLKYFLRMCDFTEPSWEIQISIHDFYAEMDYVFGQNNVIAKDSFKKSIIFLIRNRLLLRSADQQQDEAPGLSIAEIEKIENVYVSGAAIALWRELGKSSALFQLFLDDIWLETDSGFFSESGNDIEHCLLYLNQLFRTEQNIFNSVENLESRRKEQYLLRFGSVPVCKQLLNGLIASLEAIKESGDFRSQSRIRAARESLRQARILKSKIDRWKR